MPHSNLSHSTLPGGLDVITLSNQHGQISISPFGAHLLSYKNAKGIERLWVSERAITDGSAAIRGGVPVCWPWFGPHPTDSHAPQHGWARTMQWSLVSHRDLPTGSELVFIPASETKAPLRSALAVKLIVTLSQQLTITLRTTNLDSEPAFLNAALHTYFAVSDVKNVKLVGLQGQYSDKLCQGQLFETPEVYQINSETDRVHHCYCGNVTLIDGEQQINIGSSGHDSIVVWNPWQAKSQEMKDMTDDGYLTMICVETALTGDVKLAGGASHTLEQTIS